MKPAPKYKQITKMLNPAKPRIAKLSVVKKKMKPYPTKGNKSVFKNK